MNRISDQPGPSEPQGAVVAGRAVVEVSPPEVVSFPTVETTSPGAPSSPDGKFSLFARVCHAVGDFLKSLRLFQQTFSPSRAPAAKEPLPQLADFPGKSAEPPVCFHDLTQQDMSGSGTGEYSPRAVSVAQTHPSDSPANLDPGQAITTAIGDLNIPEAHIPTEFYTVCWEAALAEAQKITVNEVKALLDRQESLLFEEWCKPAEEVAVVHRPSAVPRELWFIGDLHGDLLALANAWHYIQQECARAQERPHVVFLGDFVDRGLHHHETLLYLFQLLRDYPQQIGVLPGNHDEDFCWDEATGKFRSGVTPAEYADTLNDSLLRDDQPSRDQVELGKLAYQFFQRRTRAVVLPDGLLLAHAGFPHTDLQGKLCTRKDLSRPECAQDFVWLRISATSPIKLPNRANRACEFGYEDFAQFCQIATEKLRIPVRRMLRGHDHLRERYRHYPKYWQYPILTINTMCRRLEDEFSGDDELPLACVARYIPDQLPLVHRLPINKETVESVYRPAQSQT